MATQQYRLRVPTSLATLIRGMHPQLKRKLRASLSTVLSDPTVGNALRDELEGLRSYRMGRLRIIYRLSTRGRVIELVAVGPRSRIYEDTLRYVKQDQTRVRDRKNQGS